MTITSKTPPLLALIMTAGSGQRAKIRESDLPKQYHLLEGQPLINWSLKVFLEHPQLIHVQVVYDPDHHTFYEEALRTLSLPDEFLGKLLPPVRGGHTQQESVRAGITCACSPFFWQKYGNSCA